MQITVIVPVRNGESTIARCVESLVAQDFAAGEVQILVVDDGSTDRTASIAREAGAEVLCVPPSGPALARNRGAAQAVGEILLFTDADCVPEPDWVARMTAPFADPEVIATKGVYRTGQTSSTARFVQLEYESRYARMTEQESIDFIDTYAAGFRKSLFLDCRGFDESFPGASVEDQEFSFRYSRQEGRMVFVPDAVVVHLHADSPARYFCKKVKVGFWKFRVMVRHPDKIVSDSHTPQNLKLEMLCVLAAIVFAPLVWTTAGFWALLTAIGGFLASSMPLTVAMFRKDPRVGLLAPVLQFLRALALGIGSVCGGFSAVAGSAKMRPAGPILMCLWSVAILAVFLAGSVFLVAPLSTFVRELVVALFSVTSFLFGGWRLMRLFRRRATVELDPLEATVLEIAAGVGITVTGMFVLGVLGLYTTSAALLLLVLPLLGNPVPFLGDMRRRLAMLRTGGGGFYLVVLCLVGVMTLLESLAPETSQDALVYHLAIPDLYLRAGGIEYVPFSFFASFPQNIEMLFTLGLLLDGAAIAGFYHWFLGVGTVLGVAALARRLAGGGGIQAATMFATVPTVALISTWAYVDLGLVFFQLAAILAFVRWWDGRAPAWIILAAVHTGLAGGCKYTGGALGILLGLAIVVEGGLRRRHLLQTVRSLAVFTAVALAVVSPWLIKNLVYTGNPLHPFLHAVFGGRDWDSTRAYVLAQFLGEWGGAESAGDVLVLPLRLTFLARFFSIDNFDGFIGPAFLLASPLAISGLRRAPSLRIVFAVSVGLAVFWVLTTRQVRFLLPALACAAAVLGGSHALQRRGFTRTVLASCLGASFVFNTMMISTHFASHNPVPVVLGLEAPEVYLEREIPGGDYAVFLHIERALPPDARILFAGSGNPGYLCRREYHADAIFENRTLDKILKTGKTARGVFHEFRRRGFTHLLFRADLVFDPAGVKSDIPLSRQLVLQDFLNRHCLMECTVNGTFLYRLADEARVTSPDDRGRAP